MAKFKWIAELNKAVPLDKVEEIEKQLSESNLDIEELKAEADALGIRYQPNISARKLNERIKEHKESNE